MTEKPAVYWLTATAAEVPGDSDWLSGREKLKLQQLRFTKRRADWRLGRWVAKRAVCARALDDGRRLELADVEIVAASDGVPEPYVLGSAAGITLSISHCRDLGFTVLSDGGAAVGCDVEAVEARSDRFVTDYFTAGEAERVRGAAAGERLLLINLIWSGKESALKAARKGLSRDTRSVEVGSISGGFDCEGAWAPLSLKCLDTGRELWGWWRRQGDFVLTIACDAPTDLPEPLR
jgi:4'-phosphopantetheinyl transferase